MTGHIHFVFVNARRSEIHHFKIFGGHLGRHLGKYATVVIVFYIFDFYVHFILYESTLHSFLYLKAELRYIRIRFSAAILASILENMQLLLSFSTYLISTFFISYESTLHLSLYLKAELRYIRSRISAAILAAIFNFFNLFI